METYYVNTVSPVFTEQMIASLEDRGMKEKKTLPVDFLFLSGDSALQKNKVDSKHSRWISMLWGKSVDTLTNKVSLHRKYGDRDFLIDSQIIEKGDEIPKLSGRTLKILKPLKGYKGEGITVLSKTSELEEWLETHSKYEEWLLQNYIRNPALKDGYKFHLRVLVVVKKNPLEVYVATHKFYVKAEEKYKKDDWLNPRIHDTHYKPGKIETFPQSLPDDWSSKDGEKLDTKINHILKELLEDEKDFKAEWNAKNGFHIFGADIIFDKKKPYLLEFNKKTSLDGRAFYAEGIVRLIIDGIPEPYFTRIL